MSVEAEYHALKGGSTIVRLAEKEPLHRRYGTAGCYARLLQQCSYEGVIVCRRDGESGLKRRAKSVMVFVRNFHLRQFPTRRRIVALDQRRRAVAAAVHGK